MKGNISLFCVLLAETGLYKAVAVTPAGGRVIAVRTKTVGSYGITLAMWMMVRTKEVAIGYCQPDGDLVFTLLDIIGNIG